MRYYPYLLLTDYSTSITESESLHVGSMLRQFNEFDCDSSWLDNDVLRPMWF